MIKPSEEVVREVRAKIGPKTMLAFSRGKDSIAAYLAIRDSFEDVVPYHLFIVPGLEFVEESLVYYEKVFGRKIWNLPHPGLYGWLRTYLFQPPGRAEVLAAANLPDFEYLDVAAMVAEEEGLDFENQLIANGVRAADSQMRRVSFMSHGAISWNKKTYSPVWDWNKERLIQEITKSGIKLPVDYDLFGRSFDGLDLRFLYPLKIKRPDDYRRVLEVFPLADLECWRYEKTLNS